jgi:hypothetical protein
LSLPIACFVVAGTAAQANRSSQVVNRRVELNNSLFFVVAGTAAQANRRSQEFAGNFSEAISVRAVAANRALNFVAALLVVNMFACFFFLPFRSMSYLGLAVSKCCVT